MARKLNSAQRKFKTAAKAANKICHASTSTPTAYGRCMRDEMKSRLGSKKRGGKKKKR